MAEQKIERKQRKLKNLMIDSSFQTKIIVLVTGFVIMQSLLVTGYLQLLFSQNYDNLLALLDSDSEVLFIVQSFRSEVMIGIITANVGFIFASILLSIHFSHKLAGPNYAIKRAINNLLNGVDHDTIVLRKGDEYHDLADRINTLFVDYHLIKKDRIEDYEI